MRDLKYRLWAKFKKPFSHQIVWWVSCLEKAVAFIAEIKAARFQRELYTKLERNVKTLNYVYNNRITESEKWS